MMVPSECEIGTERASRAKASLTTASIARSRARHGGSRPPDVFYSKAIRGNASVYIVAMLISGTVAAQLPGCAKISTATKFQRPLVGAVSFSVTDAPAGIAGGNVSFCTQ